jgi:iron(III) transport system ATP-binding protein
MSLLTIRGLGKRYGAVEALAGIDLDVAAGSRTAIVGPSGSGKTTLLRLVAGFEAPDAGEIALAGKPIANASAGVPTHRRNIGLVMQEGALFPHLSVRQNISFGIRHEASAASRALELMELVELERSMAERFPHQLSGGQQQRVALARALARRPQIMLLDEPFSALDTGLREHMREAASRILAAADIATVLVTHDQDEAMSFADQLVVLREGRLVQAGRPRDVYAAPADVATALLLGPSVILAGEVRDGVAHCALGPLPLREDQRLPLGPAKLMLRPEQISLVAAAGGTPSRTWRVSSVGQTGSLARVTLRQEPVHGDGDGITLVAMARDIPPAGSMVNAIVLGAAHRLQ